MGIYDDMARDTADDMVDEYERQELEERIRAQEKDDQVRQIRLQRHYANLTNQAVNNGVLEACKEAGISLEEYSRMTGEDPDQYISQVQKSTKKHTHKVIAKARKRNAKGQFVQQPAAKQSPTGRPAKSLQDVQKGNYANSRERYDDMINTVVDSLGPEFFTP